MKIFILISVSLFSAMAIGAVGSAQFNLIRTAVATKALMERGTPIPSVIDVIPVDQTSIPPLGCILIVYDRKPNTECPGENGQGEFLDKGYVTCFKHDSVEVDSIHEVESQCPPPFPKPY